MAIGPPFEAAQSLTSAADPSPITLPDAKNQSEEFYLEFADVDGTAELVDDSSKTEGVRIDATTTTKGPFHLASWKANGMWLDWGTATQARVTVVVE